MTESKNTHSVTDDQFDAEVVKSSQLALVDFWAEWCGPCRLLTPTLEQIAGEYEGQLKLFKMNVDENQKTPTQFNIRGIPTIIFFKNGEMVDQLVGNHPKEKIITVIQKHL